MDILLAETSHMTRLCAKGADNVVLGWAATSYPLLRTRQDSIRVR